MRLPIEEVEEIVIDEDDEEDDIVEKLRDGIDGTFN